MSLSLSAQEISALFGVGVSLNVHLQRLQAAQCFYQIRKEIEKNQTRLASFEVQSFKKISPKFRTKLEDAVNEESTTGRRKLLLSIVQDNCTAHGIRQFVLACLSLSDNYCENLKATGLIDIFPKLFRSVVGPVAVPSETMAAILALVDKVCVESDNPSSRQLKGWFSQDRRKAG